jgi:hypothetical protein
MITIGGVPDILRCMAIVVLGEGFAMVQDSLMMIRRRLTSMPIIVVLDKSSTVLFPFPLHFSNLTSMAVVPV